VECRAPQAVERVAVARPAIADRHVSSAQPREQLANVGRIDLRIGRQRHDRAAARAFKAGSQRRGFAETARQIDDGEFLTLAQQRLERASHLGARSIEHEDEFVRSAGRRDIGAVFAIQRADIGCAAHADRHDHGKRRRSVGLHGPL
jgi:hypothetical protein